MELNEMTAERMIAALVKSNGGSLVLKHEDMELSYDGLMLQVYEDIAADQYILRIVEERDVTLDEPK